MKIHPNLLFRLKRIKENPLDVITNLPYTIELEAGDFDVAIDLCNRYAHGRNKDLTDRFIKNRESLLRGEEIAPFCRDIESIISSLKYNLPNYHRYEQHELILEAIDSAYPKSRYAPFLELKSKTTPLHQVIHAKAFLDASLAELEKIDIDEIELLINECLKQQEEN